MNESGSQSQDSVMSPAQFIAGLQHSTFLAERAERPKIEPTTRTLSDKHSRNSMIEGGRSSEKSHKKRLAGLKSRQKKRKELEDMEENVNSLTAKIQQCDRQLSRCKDELVEAIKLSTNSSSQHAFTFSELQKQITAEDIDLDQINMLLDIIQSRVGANGKERHTKLEYNFKQIINSLFPAMHRYLMYSALHQKDLFYECNNQTGSCQHVFEKWSKPLYDEVRLSQQIIYQIAERKPYFIKKRFETIELICKLKRVKSQLKRQQSIIQKMLTHIRQDMNPIQSSRVILFGQKNKLRRQFLFLDEIFVYQDSPSKQIKLQ